MSADELPDRGEIFDLLSNHRRRYTIHFCKQQGETVTVSDLAEQVAAWELDKEIAEIDSAERKRVYTSLQQTHLPTLDDAGMVVYENGEVTLTEQAERMEVYMDIVPGDSIPWGEYYLGLSVIGALVLAGVWFEVLPTETVPEVGWAFAVLMLFAGSAAYHVYQGRQNRLGEMERPP
ncbi:DUF7344 domain-containing protein [Natranaeroarchaeum sulfidigenes]|uniref:Putative trancriptional regulator, ArsR family n=1 Tax=Natranaeroarchaeum sulfidigenes TaxID=2784880 RepID=A0A897MTU2_9EURY|nr:hypothetical protein [Natranaeroarchaeum sulfidigenes]QSG01616.1 putative trancriptional regulator, ArsR family [Natranaeroarchaeum sulfidigenes]